MEESTGGGGVQQLGLNNSHATENPSNNSSRNGPKNVSIISHLNKKTDAQDDDHEDEDKSTLLASMEEYRENKSEVATTLQQDQGINEPESNPTVVDVPTPTKQKSKTKESKNPEPTKATEQTKHVEGGSNRRNNASSLKSDGITSPSPKSSSDQQHNPTPTHADEMLEENEQLDPIHVGRVIGKGGEMIRDLQARSACRIDVDQNVAPGQPRIITYRGTRKTVDFAKNLVQILCSDAIKMGEMDLPLGEAKQKVVSVPASSIGRIIGRYDDGCFVSFFYIFRSTFVLYPIVSYVFH
jgi:predicted RNA-binding protein YlqC (UPF0109 family)